MFRATLVIIIGLTLTRWGMCGTVITANLPANTAIINIDGTQEGAANYANSTEDALGGTTQGLWYQPFFTGGASSLLEYTIQPGTYQFQLTTPTLAATAYPALTGPQLSEMFTAWTYNSPWGTDYLVFTASAASNPAEAQLFTGAVVPYPLRSTYANATDAFNAADTGGYANEIVAGPEGRYHGTTATQYTFAAVETLIFAVPDNILGDNDGGVSVLITPVPEPASLFLLTMGGLTLLLFRLRAERWSK